MTLEELPHSESWGSSLACSSPQTFRRSPRPSSVFSAKASTSYSVELVVPLFSLHPPMEGPDIAMVFLGLGFLWVSFRYLD